MRFELPSLWSSTCATAREFAFVRSHLPHALLAGCLLLGAPDSSAGRITQSVNFSTLNAIATCNAGESCFQTWSGQGLSGPGMSFFFQSFNDAAAARGLSGTTLVGVHVELHGILTLSSTMIAAPGSTITVGTGVGAFPLFGLGWISDPLWIPDRSIGLTMDLTCDSQVCQASASLPFHIETSVPDIAHFLDNSWSTDYLGLESTPDYFGRPNSVLGVLIAGFQGTNNYLQLTYHFVPEPSTLAVLFLGVGIMSVRIRALKVR